MWTIVSALKSELSPLFSYFPVLEKLSIGGGAYYRSEFIQMVRAGVGRDNVRQVLDVFLNRNHPDLVLNIGLAGSLKPENEPGQIFYIREVLHETAKIAFNLPKLVSGLDLPAARLLTVDKAVTESGRRDRLHKKRHVELVDMEAYFLAQKCAEKGIPFCSIKIISDMANQETQKVFMGNYQEKSQMLCAVLRPFLPKGTDKKYK